MACCLLFSCAEVHVVEARKPCLAIACVVRSYSSRHEAQDWFHGMYLGGPAFKAARVFCCLRGSYGCSVCVQYSMLQLGTMPRSTERQGARNMHQQPAAKANKESLSDRGGREGGKTYLKCVTFRKKLRTYEMLPKSWFFHQFEDSHDF